MTEVFPTQRTLDLLREEWTRPYREALETIANTNWRPDHEMSPGSEWLPALNTVVEIAQDALDASSS